MAATNTFAPSWSSFHPDECPAFRPCYHPEDCWDAHATDTSPENGGACTSCCWRLMWTMLTAGVILIAYGDISISRTSVGTMVARYLQKVKEYRRNVKWYQSQQCKHQHQRPLSPEEINLRIQQTQDRKKDIFTTTNTRNKVRLFSNFSKDLCNPTVQLPEAPQGREYTPKQYGIGSYSFSAWGMISNLGHILSTQYIYAIVWSSLGWGLFASGISTYVWLQHSHGEFCVEQGYYESDTMTERSQRFTEIYTRIRFDYLYLTLFVLTGYVAFVAARWRGWLQNCHDIQHGLHSVAMLCGGAIKNPAHHPTLLSQAEIDMMRFKLHKIYRYLNCIHAMTYLTTSQKLQNLSVKETLHDQLGLLTQEELDDVGPNIQHDLPMAVVLSWLSNAVMDLLYSTTNAKGNSSEPFSLAYTYTPAYSQLAPLQKACENHENCYVLNQPNFYRDVVLVAMTIFMLMVILGEPFGSFVYVGRDTVNTESLILPCFQPLTIYSVFVLTVAVRTLFLSIMVLNNPFEYQSEQISVDHLLASSERSIFFHLRANFGRSVSSQATGKYGTTTDDDETSHTARESIASFAEETRHSMAMKRWQEPSSHHHRGSSHHHRDSDRTQKSQSNVSFANDLVFSNSSHDPKGTRPSDASFGLEELARMQNSKVSFADVLVEEMTPLTSKADNDGNRSHAATFMTKGPGVKGFLRSLSDGSRGSGKTFRTVSKHASNSSTDLDAAGPRSILRRSWTSGSSSLTFPLPDTELEHDEPSVTSFVSSSSGTW